MLGKLFKHDMLSLSRFLIPMHVLVLVLSLVGRFLITNHLDTRDPSVIVVLVLLTYITVLVFISVATVLLTAVRFYKNMFTDEGYLTLTIPASPTQHLLSKWFSGALWSLIDFIIIFLSLIILLLTPDTIFLFKKMLLELTVSGISLPIYVLQMVLITIFSVLIGPLFLYLCIAIGQLFSNHRLLGAIVAYFVFTIIMQIIVFAVLIGSGAFPIGLSNSVNIEFNTVHYLSTIFNLATISSLIEAFVAYFGTLYIIKRRINLN